jgi:hypothetical protein
MLLLTLVLQEKPSQRVRDLIEKLGSEKIEDRESAAKALVSYGKSALPALEEAIMREDKELSSRARGIVESIMDQLAPDTLGQIEQALSQAKTIRVIYKSLGEVRFKEGTTKLMGQGAVLLKESRKLRLEVEYNGVGYEPGERSSAIVLSIGDRLKRKEPGKEWIESPLPANLTQTFAILLTRVGTVSLNEMGLGHAGETDDVGKRYQISDVHSCLRDEKGDSLTFKVKDTKEPGTIEECRLWYDAKTFRLIQRKWKVKDQKTELGLMNAEMCDTFDEFILNGDIPEAKFQLPEKEK